MRFEAKHKRFKQWARNTSYRNLCWTLALKYQQCAAYSLSSSVEFSSSQVVQFTSSTLFHFAKYIYSLVHLCLQIIHFPMQVEELPLVILPMLVISLHWKVSASTRKSCTGIYRSYTAINLCLSCACCFACWYCTHTGVHQLKFMEPSTGEIAGF